MTLVLVVMYFVLVLCPALIVAGVQMLTIDSQLGTSIEDCFERITIGEQLPFSAIFRNVSELTTRECEQICKQDKQCQVYDYGVGAKGNATCNLSKFGDTELKKTKLLRNPDYDIYLRRVQCEQGPPIPAPPLSDEPLPSNDGPVHRPVFRPVDDEPRRPDDQYPLADEYHRPQDLRPYERPSIRPSYVAYSHPYGYRPNYPVINNHLDDRPDDYGNQKPEFDEISGYGAHKPQDIPFTSEKPHRPLGPVLEKPKPDPNDVLNLQYPYGRPPSLSPGFWRPDPYFPSSPEDDIHDIYGPKPLRPYSPVRPIEENPNYHYIVRPSKRPPFQSPPRPQVDFGYAPIKPYGDHPDNGYGQNPHLNRPTVPPSPPYRPGLPNHDYHSEYPSRPYEKPSYSYNSQYASSYGQNSNYDQGNSIYLEIHDPLRPYKPPKKPLDRPVNTGYGQTGHDDGGYSGQSSYSSHGQEYHSSQTNNAYTQNYESSSGYGQNDHNYTPTPNQNEYNRPQQNPVRPVAPIYGSQGDYGYGSQSYGSQSSQSYGSQSSQAYGNPSSQTYGNQNTQLYGGQYDNQNSYYGSQRPQKPYKRPPQTSNQSGYGTDHHNYDHQSGYGNQGSYISNNQGYGSQNNYGSDQSHHASYQPNYGTTQSHQDPHYDRPDQEYGNEPDNEDEGYKNNRPKPSTTQKPSYKPKPDQRPGYGNRRPETDKRQPGYGLPEPDNQTGYGQKPDPSMNRPSYNQTSGYGRPDVKPVYEYDLEKPNGRPEYIVRPDGQVVTSRPVSISDYGNRRPAIGNGRNPGHRNSYEACFRRVLAGKRALRSHVRRVVPCERLEDCRRECAVEKRFHCESFNYKLDPSFRGKGLCELMTKPIEAFDLQRDFVADKDFDFFELDRNSLEPDCPETLRGPGMLHSGFLSSRPDNLIAGDHKWDRYDEPYSSGRDYHRGFGDRRGGYGGRRKQEPYVPYQIGLARSNDDDDSWGQYGGSYGGSKTYYKDRSDFQTSVNHWRLNTPTYEEPYIPTADFDYNNLGRGKYEDTDYGYAHWKRGKWNTSDVAPSGLSYGESSYYRPSTPAYRERPDDEVKANDCSPRRRPGMSLGTGAIRRSLRARNVVACETACFHEKEFKCVSYSYRYSTTLGVDNCFLSERPYRGAELSSDSGSDVYAMPQDHGCSGNSKPWIESECFWHVRSESAVSGAAVKAALTVAGLGACEAECIRAHQFFCRGFSFRYDAPKIGEELENCLLTSSPPTSLEPGNGLSKLAGYEMYARGNYGRGCEPALYDETHRREKQCYLQYDNAARLMGSAVKGHARVKDEESCGDSCTNAPFRCLSFSYNNVAPSGSDNCLLSEVRLFDLQRGVDYEHSADDWLFAFDLFNGECWRKVHGKSQFEDPTHELPRPITAPSTDVHDPPRSGPSGSGYLPSGPHGPDYSRPSGSPYIPGSGPPSGPGYKPTSPSDYLPLGPSGYKPDPTGPFKPGYLPDQSFKPGYLPEPSGPSYRPTSSGFKPAYPETGYVPDPGYRPSYRPDYNRPPSFVPSGPSGPSYGDRPDPGYRPGPSGPPGPGYPGNRGDEEPIIVSWRHYTVSGFPCRKGTSCAQNQVGGHWACEPEGGEIGSWDYCCTPTHRCGYSEGFHKPWCYVGDATSQWRPCSEKYYPYHQHSVPHPSQGTREQVPRPSYGPPESSYRRPAIDPISETNRKPGYAPGHYLPEADRRYWDSLYKNGPQAYYDKYGNPLPGYARVPTANRPHIKFQHHYPPPAGPGWEPISSPAYDDGLDPPVPGGLGAPRYWPVAYLHKGPPPNMTYFRFNETDQITNRNDYQYNRTPILPPKDIPATEFNQSRADKVHKEEKIEARKEKNRNITDEDVFNDRFVEVILSTTTTTPKVEIKEVLKEIKESILKPNISDIVISTVNAENVKATEKAVPKKDAIIGIDDKLVDFSGSTELAKSGSKLTDLKTLEAEEAQIAAIGRFVASQRGGKLVLEKRSQKDLEAEHVAVHEHLIQDFDFGNKFPTERKGRIQKVTKDEIDRERNNDKSLEVSETTFVRPPRVLSTTDNIRKAMVNGKVFYDATVREPRDLFLTHNSTRKFNKMPTSRVLDDVRAPSVFTNQTFGKKKTIRARNINPVRRVRRIYRKRYNPEEVRRRLLERDRTKQDGEASLKQKA